MGIGVPSAGNAADQGHALGPSTAWRGETAGSARPEQVTKITIFVVN
jgi:hypothetical protein